MRLLLRVLLVAALVTAGALATRAEGETAGGTVTIGYQLVYNPWKSAIQSGAFEAATGYKIKWRRFESGSKVIAAIASGDVDIALAGSSPIAAGVSRGIQLQLFWIAEDIAAAEALVVRDGAGIVAPQDLKGKRIGVPFASTTHFHTLFALEQFGIDADQVSVENFQPDEIPDAWRRGLIDAAFVWGPALASIKESGKVLITSGQLSSWGKATFDGLVVRPRFAQAHPAFMTSFVEIVAAADAAYRDDPAAWTPESAEVQAVVELVGGSASDVPELLALYRFPTLEEQVSCDWLGCGGDGGAARALTFTSEFLKAEGKISYLQPDYSVFVNPEFARAALAAD